MRPSHHSRSRWRWPLLTSFTQREARALRAFELRAERARYDASRAERAFNLCEPENRLVARSLEQRWEAKLAAVAEAEAALEAQKAQRPPLPDTADLQTLAADLRQLWDKPTTSPRDRKRVLRTLIADVTLCWSLRRPSPTRASPRSGAHEQHTATRTRMRTEPSLVDRPHQAPASWKTCVTPTSPLNCVPSGYGPRGAMSSWDTRCA